MASMSSCGICMNLWNPFTIFIFHTMLKDNGLFCFGILIYPYKLGMRGKVIMLELELKVILCILEVVLKLKEEFVQHWRSISKTKTSKIVNTFALNNNMTRKLFSTNTVFSSFTIKCWTNSSFNSRKQFYNKM